MNRTVSGDCCLARNTSKWQRLNTYQSQVEIDFIHVGTQVLVVLVSEASLLGRKATRYFLRYSLRAQLPTELLELLDSKHEVGHQALLVAENRHVLDEQFALDIQLGSIGLWKLRNAVKRAEVG